MTEPTREEVENDLDIVKDSIPGPRDSLDEDALARLVVWLTERALKEDSR